MSTTNVSPDDAVARAEELQRERLNAVRGVATARQNLDDVRAATDRELEELRARIGERVADAQRDDADAFAAAVKAGWSEAELKKIGFDKPGKKPRARRRSSAAPKQPAGASASTAGDGSTTEV